MRKPKAKIIVALAFVIAVAALIGWRVRASRQPRATTGRTAEVRRGDISVSVNESGTLEPVVKVDVKSRVAGRVLRIFVREGDTVRPGTPIAVVDATEVARQVAGIKAQLAAAQAGLRQAEEGYTLARRQTVLAIRRAEASLATARLRLREVMAAARPQEVAEAQQVIARAQAQAADARRTLARRRALLARGFVSQSDVDAARTALDVAETEVSSARERLSLLRAGARSEAVEIARAGVREAQIQLDTERANAAQDRLRLRDVERARAQVAQIENQLAEQSVQLGETRIVAPIAGEIVRKYLEEGELIASATAGFAQGAAIVTIADLGKMQVRVNINEVDVARVRVGQDVDIRVEGMSSAVFRGRVASIAPASTTALSAPGQNAGESGRSVVRFEVKIAVADRDRRLRPGMTAGVEVIQNRKRNVLLLPQEAVRDNSVTVVTGAGEKAVKAPRRVQTGLKDIAFVEIVSGLRQGDRVEIPRIDAKDRRRIEINGGPD